MIGKKSAKLAAPAPPPSQPAFTLNAAAHPRRDPLAIGLRIPQSLFNVVRADLCRQHSFAAERVGFLFAREAPVSAGSKLLLASSYQAIPDEDYVDTRDPFVGAEIGSMAIRRAMQHALTSGDSVFHVHEHLGEGTPGFSTVDLKSLSELVPPFYVVARHAIHGAVLLNRKQAIACIWVASESRFEAVPVVSVIGYPLQRWEARHDY